MLSNVFCKQISRLPSSPRWYNPNQEYIIAWILKSWLFRIMESQWSITLTVDLLNIYCNLWQSRPNDFKGNLAVSAFHLPCKLIHNSWRYIVENPIDVGPKSCIYALHVYYENRWSWYFADLWRSRTSFSNKYLFPLNVSMIPCRS